MPVSSNLLNRDHEDPYVLSRVSFTFFLVVLKDFGCNFSHHRILFNGNENNH